MSAKVPYKPNCEGRHFTSARILMFAYILVAVYISLLEKSSGRTDSNRTAHDLRIFRKTRVQHSPERISCQRLIQTTAHVVGVTHSTEEVHVVESLWTESSMTLQRFHYRPRFEHRAHRFRDAIRRLNRRKQTTTHLQVQHSYSALGALPTNIFEPSRNYYQLYSISLTTNQLQKITVPSPRFACHFHAYSGESNQRREWVSLL